MPALKISKRDPELERGEKSAYNFCEVLHRTEAMSTWIVVPLKGLDYIVSARLELQGVPLGGPPLCEMANKTQMREAARWGREVARHLARMAASATFWSFPAKMRAAKTSPEFVVHVEAVPEGLGTQGHTLMMLALRRAAALTDQATQPRARRGRKRRRS